VDPKRIYAASFSMYQPVSGEKSKNRRVEIVVLPSEEPVSASAAETSLAR